MTQQTSTTPAPRVIEHAPKIGKWPRAEYERLSAASDMPPASATDLHVERDIAVDGADGSVLLTDHWYAATATESGTNHSNTRGSVVLIRTPYGRRGFDGVAKFAAERGHHVVIQSCRGTFGSSGTFDPMAYEAGDGQATMRWLRSQQWATGQVHSWGFSYVGLTQWALADGELRPDAMVIGLSSRSFDESMVYPGGGFAMETALTWSYSLGLQERPFLAKLWGLIRAKGRVAKAGFAIPPTDGPRAASGREAAFVNDWFAHSAPGDAWWAPRKFAKNSGSPRTTLIAGWQDLFLLGTFDDFRALTARGDDVRIHAGDWTHHGDQAGIVAVRELMRGLHDPAAADSSARVHVDVVGGEARTFDHWPPAAALSTFALGAEGSLSLVPETSAGAAGSTLSYRYDPSDPTPSIAGRGLNPFNAGRKDQQAREARPDVLSFATDALASDLEIIGDPVVDLALASTNPRFDVFVLLCDVDEKGISLPIADGYVRRDPDDSGSNVRLILAPTAYRVPAGHRVRLQVSSGAHPLFLRNPGTTDPLGDFSRLSPSEQTLTIGGAEPSVLTLPILNSPSQETS